MHYIVHALDKPRALPRRLDVIEAHRAWLQQPRDGIRILISGPLTEEDGETMKGSLFLFEADSRATVEAMLAGDPLARAGVWERVDITRFWMRQMNL